MSVEEKIAEDAAYLGKLLDYFRVRMAQPLDIPPALEDLGAAALSILRAMVAYGEAIRVLAETEFAEAAAPIARAVLEGAGEIRFMLEAADPNRSGVENMVFGLLEFRDHAQGALTGGDVREMRAAVENRLDALRQRHPTVVAEMEQRRRQLYASTGRLDLMKRMGADRAEPGSVASVYRLLAFDSHMVLNAGLDVVIEATDHGTSFRFGARQEPKDAGQFASAIAAHALDETWARMMDRIGIDGNVAADPPKPTPAD